MLTELLYLSCHSGVAGLILWQGVIVTVNLGHESYDHLSLTTNSEIFWDLSSLSLVEKLVMTGYLSRKACWVDVENGVKCLRKKQ